MHKNLPCLKNLYYSVENGQIKTKMDGLGYSSIEESFAQHGKGCGLLGKKEGEKQGDTRDKQADKMKELPMTWSKDVGNGNVRSHLI